MSPDLSLFPRLAAQQAQSPALRALFEQLTERAESLAKLRDELQKTIRSNREARTGKPFHFAKRQEQTLADFTGDAVACEKELPARVARLGDAGMLGVALRSEQQQLESEERLYAVFREDNQAASNRVLAFRRETLEIIQRFVENSEFKETVLMRRKVVGRAPRKRAT
jgi:hypothetical protein